MSRRYLLLRVICERPVSSEEFGTALINSVRRCFGEFGLSRIEPRLIRFNSEKLEVIVSCKRETMDELQAAIALISDLSGTPIIPLALSVSGTIKGLARRKRRQGFSSPA